MAAGWTAPVLTAMAGLLLTTQRAFNSEKRVWVCSESLRAPRAERPSGCGTRVPLSGDKRLGYLGEKLN